MKIFGLGLSKTGTRSLAKALTILGYNTIHYPWSMDDIHKHEASLDIPVACRYKQLDAIWPGSKFILTTRPFEDWIERRRQKPPDPHTPPAWKLETRLLMYGDVNFNEELYAAAYHRHHKDVAEYFTHRSSDLLVLPLATKNKWELLCAFLGEPIPDVEYPWEGKAGYDPLLGRIGPARRMFV